MTKALDLSNKRFGSLVAVETTSRNKRGQRIWTCKCDCGKTTHVISGSLVSGNTKSCGCLNSKMTIRRNFRHGMTKTRIYNIWCRMRQRCSDKKCREYKLYGGRGITVCEEWQDFIQFHDWARESGYEENLTIDRIDVNGNYEPDNCRWATRLEQGNNKGNNHVVEYNGESRTIAEWSRETGVKGSLIRWRLKQGWDLKDVFNKKIEL